MSKKNSARKPALEIPKEIRQLALEFRKQRVEKEQTKKRREWEKEVEEKRLHASRLKKGWKRATKIFLWAHALKDSDLGQELIKKADARLIFFDDHIVGVEPWVGLGISRNGLVLVFRSPSGHQQYVHSPKDLAKSVITVVLEAASDSIDNGEVWNCIKRRLDCFKK